MASHLIGRVFDLARVISERAPVNIELSDGADEALWDSGCGPDFDTIQAFLAFMGLEHIFSVNDVLSTYHVVLGRAARLGDTGLAEVLLWENFQATPQITGDASPISLRVESERTMLTVAYLSRLHELHVLVPGWKPCSGSSLVSGEVAAFTDPSLPGLALRDSDVKLVDAVTDLVSSEVAHKLWQVAECDQDIHLAIAMQAYCSIGEKGGLPLGTALRGFKLGSAFITSLRANECDGTQRFSTACLGLCSQIIANSCTRRIGQFGKPDQVQRLRDGALGYRVHLTSSHEALRLMYWETDSGIEFANVGPKHELIIQEGIASGIISSNSAALFP